MKFNRGQQNTKALANKKSPALACGGEKNGKNMWKICVHKWKQEMN